MTLQCVPLPVRSLEERSRISLRAPMATAALEIRQIPGKGRAVFAKRRFEKGECIERVTVLLLSPEEEPTDPTSVLYHYVFGWGPDYKYSALALGCGSLYNHSYWPNAYYLRDEPALCIDFIACEEIEEGQEITINYTGHPHCKDPVWFEVE